jgi:hypothetical protein
LPSFSLQQASDSLPLQHDFIASFAAESCFMQQRASL